MDEKPMVYRGSKEICAAVGINYKEISFYRDHHDLPVFKITSDNGRRTQWLALPEDLENWVKNQRNIYLKK
jgi:hypothetical protein